jgi:hypothetical protein
MRQSKFRIGDFVIGNDSKASFWGRTGLITVHLPATSEYGVKFADRPEVIEYVLSAWIDLVPALSSL